MLAALAKQKHGRAQSIRHFTVGLALMNTCPPQIFSGSGVAAQDARFRKEAATKIAQPTFERFLDRVG